MAIDYSKVKMILSSYGYSWTRPRELVFKAITGGPKTISAVIKLEQGKVDRVSVYRTLQLFEELGIIHRLYLGWKYKFELSDQFIAHHHHLVCNFCAKVIDIEDEQHINSFIKKESDKFDFKPTSHQFEIEGVCSDCSAKQLLVAA